MIKNQSKNMNKTDYIFKIIDFEVVEVGFCMSWVYFIYNIYDKNNNLVCENWKTDKMYATMGFDATESEFVEWNDDETEFVNHYGETMSAKEYDQYEKDLYYEIYTEHTDDGIEFLASTICRSSIGIGWDECNSDMFIDDIYCEIEKYCIDYNNDESV